MTRKHTKYTNDWFKELKTIIPKTEKVNQVDQSVVDKLKEERRVLVDSIETKQKEIKRQEDLAQKEEGKLTNKNKWKDFEGSYSAETGYTPAKYRGEGWRKLTKDWLEGDANGNVVTATINSTDYEITEDEAIYLLTRAVKAFEGINQTDFNAWLVKTENAQTKDGVLHTNIVGYLNNIQNQARHLVKNKSFGRDGWELGYNHTNFDDTKKKFLDTSLYPTRINWQEVVDFAKFIDADDQSQHLNQSNFNTEISWNVYKKGDVYTNEEIKAYISKSGINNANKYYKNGYKKADNNWKTNNQVEVKVKTIRDWAKLVKSLEAVIGRITANQPAGSDNIYQQLYKDTRATDEDGLFGGSIFTIDSIDETKVKIWRDVYIQKAAQLGLEKDKIETDITSKNAEIQKLITEKVTEIRTSLAAHHLEKGFKDKTQETPKGTDNRKTSTELNTIFKQLKDIRFLENNDDSLTSSESKENTAHDELKTLLTDFDSSGVKQFPNTEGATETDKCKKIKETTNDLETYHTDYEKWEKLIKFSDRQKAEFKAIKIALGKSEDPLDTLQTYKDKLKTFDASLETSFTEDLKTKWQKENNFKTSETLKSLLESVKKNDKYDDFFNEIKKGEKGFTEVKDVDAFGKLLVKEPKIVITTIKRYEYDHLDDTGEDKDKKKTQMERKIKKLLSKKGTDSLTDKEINDTLYEVAIGSKTLSTKSLKADLTEYETQDPKKNEEDKGHLQRFWPLYATIGAGVLAIGGACYYFWENITNWWNQKEGGVSEENE